MMFIGAGKQQRAGFTLIELAVVAVIVAILATFLLTRVVFYQEQAEKVAMEQTLGTLRSALHLQIADLLVNDNIPGILQLAEQNPMNWLAEKPNNYVGEYYTPKHGMVDAGKWYFDLQDKDLVYLANNSEHLRTSLGESNKIRYRLKVVRGLNSALDSAIQGNARRDAVVGVILEPALPYQWF